MNIVHRDVKGANILITEGGEIKIGTSVALHTPARCDRSSTLEFLAHHFP